jgi:hypothetical protein
LLISVAPKQLGWVMKQYLQLFKYLKEFAKLRNKVISDIDSSKQYNCVWLVASLLA